MQSKQTKLELCLLSTVAPAIVG